VAGIGHLFGPTPTVAGSVVQGMLGGLAVLGVFFAVAYPAARRDLAPLTAPLTRRLRRGRK
ncbi:virulence factor MviN, partial [Actinoplanes sp. NPDC049596]